MGSYTSLKCEALLNEDGVRIFSFLMEEGSWDRISTDGISEEVATAVKKWQEKSRHDFIPFSAIENREEWGEYCILQGNSLKFVCSLKNYNDEVESFFRILNLVSLDIQEFKTWNQDDNVETDWLFQ